MEFDDTSMVEPFECGHWHTDQSAACCGTLQDILDQEDQEERS